VERSLAASAVRVTSSPDGISVSDPSGNRIVLSVRT
jgi:hypothetical protein